MAAAHWNVKMMTNEDGVCVRHECSHRHPIFYVTDSDSTQLILSPIDINFMCSAEQHNYYYYSVVFDRQSCG